MKLLLVSSVLFMLAGCAVPFYAAEAEPGCTGLAVDDPNPPAEVGTCTGAFVLGQFDAETEQAIRDAGYAWNAFADRPIVHVSAASSPCAIEPGELAGGRVVEQRNGLITVNVTSLARADRTYLHYALVHAIGRALGMKPTSSSRGVMSTCTSDPWFTADELAECRRQNICAPAPCALY